MQPTSRLRLCLLGARTGRRRSGEPGSERTAPKKSLIDHSANTDVLPDHFCVLTLLVESVDYLNLRGNPQQRQCFEKHQGQWHSKELIP